MDFPEEMAVIKKEDSKSVRKTEFDSSEEDISKVKILSVRSLVPEPKGGRKWKVQVNEASARYRRRKRMLDETISAEVAGLESTQKKLKVKHDKLQSEIKCLESFILLRENKLLNAVHCHESPNTSVASKLLSSSSCATNIQVTDCDDVPSTSSPSEELVIKEEDFKSEIKTEFVDIGEDNPELKVTPVDFPVPSRVSKSKSRRGRKSGFVDIEEGNPKLLITPVVLPVSSWISKPKDRRERKKVQNNRASAVYRFRKRMEEEEISGEVSDLVSTQKDLQKKHDELQFEIKCLKNLMLEKLQKK